MHFSVLQLAMTSAVHETHSKGPKFFPSALMWGSSESIWCNEFMAPNTMPVIGVLIVFSFKGKAKAKQSAQKRFTTNQTYKIIIHTLFTPLFLFILFSSFFKISNKHQQFSRYISEEHIQQITLNTYKSQAYITQVSLDESFDPVLISIWVLNTVCPESSDPT